MIIEGTTQRHATGNGRQPAPAAALDGLSGLDVLHFDLREAPILGSTLLLPALATRTCAHVPGSFGEPTQFPRKSEGIFTKIARVSLKVREFSAEIAQSGPKLTPMLAYVPRFLGQSPDIFREIARLFAKSGQNFGQSPEMAPRTPDPAGPSRPAGNGSACPRPAIRMRPVRRGRLAARNSGSHPKVPPPGHRSTVFR